MLNIQELELDLDCSDFEPDEVQGLLQRRAEDIQVGFAGALLDACTIMQVPEGLEHMSELRLDLGTLDIEALCSPNLEDLCALLERRGWSKKPSVVTPSGAGNTAYGLKNSHASAAESSVLSKQNAISISGPRPGSGDVINPLRADASGSRIEKLSRFLAGGQPDSEPVFQSYSTSAPSTELQTFKASTSDHNTAAAILFSQSTIDTEKHSALLKIDDISVVKRAAEGSDYRKHISVGTVPEEADDKLLAKKARIEEFCLDTLADFVDPKGPYASTGSKHCLVFSVTGSGDSLVPTKPMPSNPENIILEREQLENIGPESNYLDADELGSRTSELTTGTSMDDKADSIAKGESALLAIKNAVTPAVGQLDSNLRSPPEYVATNSPDSTALVDSTKGFKLRSDTSASARRTYTEESFCFSLNSEYQATIDHLQCENIFSTKRFELADQLSEWCYQQLPTNLSLMPTGGLLQHLRKRYYECFAEMMSDRQMHMMQASLVLMVCSSYFDGTGLKESLKKESESTADEVLTAITHPAWLSRIAESDVREEAQQLGRIMRVLNSVSDQQLLQFCIDVGIEQASSESIHQLLARCHFPLVRVALLVKRLTAECCFDGKKEFSLPPGKSVPSGLTQKNQTVPEVEFSDVELMVGSLNEVFPYDSDRKEDSALRAVVGLCREKMQKQTFRHWWLEVEKKVPKSWRKEARVFLSMAENFSFIESTRSTALGNMEILLLCVRTGAENTLDHCRKTFSVAPEGSGQSSDQFKLEVEDLPQYRRLKHQRVERFENTPISKYLAYEEALRMCQLDSTIELNALAEQSRLSIYQTRTEYSHLDKVFVFNHTADASHYWKLLWLFHSLNSSHSCSTDNWIQLASRFLSEQPPSITTGSHKPEGGTNPAHNKTNRSGKSEINGNRSTLLDEWKQEWQALIRYITSSGLDYDLSSEQNTELMLLSIVAGSENAWKLWLFYCLRYCSKPGNSRTHGVIDESRPEARAQRSSTTLEGSNTQENSNIQNSGNTQEKANAQYIKGWLNEHSQLLDADDVELEDRSFDDLSRAILDDIHFLKLQRSRQRRLRAFEKNVKNPIEFDDLIHLLHQSVRESLFVQQGEGILEPGTRTSEVKFRAPAFLARYLSVPQRTGASDRSVSNSLSDSLIDSTSGFISDPTAESVTNSAFLPDAEDVHYVIQVPESAYAISDAGLVLFHPFLKHLVSNCQLPDHYLDPEFSPQLLNLLHYIVWGQPLDPGGDQFSPTNIGLSLLMSGYVDRKLELSSCRAFPELHRQGADQLIEAMALHWPTLARFQRGEGIRRMFAQRSALVHKRKDGWLLEVQAVGHDILLKQCPWAYTQITLPWLEGQIVVDWPTGA